MRSITVDGSTFPCQPNETVLQTLLRENIQVPNGCRQGLCQACMIRSLDNSPPVSAQVGLKDTLNYFLACICHAQQASYDRCLTQPAGRLN
ncbi:2Fe-2S iron-sulfur cluster-binding protein [Methylobacter sp.]|uniref:2Fe-2S iron-sulfur cluster-binding protein n=1 Tax=Methylobacter sp. TaxID=2051955 RepID=UPI002FDD687F